MSAAELLAAAAGGALGAVLRWWSLERLAVGTTLAADRRVALVNLVGCLLAGAAAGAAPGDVGTALLLGGLLGGFTTLSTWALAVAERSEASPGRGLVWAFVDLGLGLGAAAAGYAAAVLVGL